MVGVRLGAGGGGGNNMTRWQGAYIEDQNVDPAGSSKTILSD